MTSNLSLASAPLNDVAWAQVFELVASLETDSVQTTFVRLLLDHAAKRPDAAALREKEYGIWQTTTWGQLAVLVKRLAGGLAAAGLQRGQHVIVVGYNRPHLSAAILAAQALGAVPVPLKLRTAVNVRRVASRVAASGDHAELAVGGLSGVYHTSAFAASNPASCSSL